LLAKSLITRGRLKEAESCPSSNLNETKALNIPIIPLFWTAQTEIQLGNAEGARRFSFPSSSGSRNSNGPVILYLLGLLDLKEKKFSGRLKLIFEGQVSSSKKKEWNRASFFG